jgi:hypothetical protein
MRLRGCRLAAGLRVASDRQKAGTFFFPVPDALEPAYMSFRTSKPAQLSRRRLGTPGSQQYHAYLDTHTVCQSSNGRCNNRQVQAVAPLSVCRRTFLHVSPPPDSVVHQQLKEGSRFRVFTPAACNVIQQFTLWRRGTAEGILCSASGITRTSCTLFASMGCVTWGM